MILRSGFSGFWLGAASMLLSVGAQAQSPSCELLKQTLATRIPPEIRGYAMDDVPARTPVPPGGKVIGTCEGGARKVIYRRFGGAPLNGEGVAAPASAPAPITAATPTPSPAPASAPAPATPAPKPAPAPVVVQKEAPKPKVEPRATVQPAVVPAASAPVMAVPKPAPVLPSPPAPASSVRIATAAVALSAPLKPVAAEKPADPPAPAPLPAEPPAVATPQAAEPGDDGAGLFGRHGHWLWLLLAVPLATLAWRWVSHRMAYDSAGLPRGPRL